MWKFFRISMTFLYFFHKDQVEIARNCRFVSKKFMFPLMDTGGLLGYNKQKTKGGKDMDEEKKEVRTDFRKTGNANQALTFRLIAVALVLYWLFGIIKAYFEGGPEAPSLLLLIIAIVVMGGGAAFVGLLAYKTWKKAKADAAMTEEEIAEMEALRNEDEA